VLFGGFLCATCTPAPPEGDLTVGDTWEWDGTVWTQRMVPGPPPRAQHAMTYDPARERVVLFGGSRGADVRFGDIWEWDGTAWTERGTISDPTIGPSGAPLGRPAPRNRHGLVYDRGNNVLLVHGGQYFLSDPNVRGGETWALAANGQWTLRSVAVANTGPWLPDHRSLAYDYDEERVLLFTAVDITGALAGTLWEWDGFTWLIKAGIPWRENAALVYDEARERTTLVGGERAFAPRSDVWEWQYFDLGAPCE
jgi:hypothetical protein